MENNYPLVLVFYLNREALSDSRIGQPFVESINEMIKIKKLNMIAFFMPTDGEERIECINPVTATKEQMEKINKMIDEINNQFGLNTKIDLPNDLSEDLMLDEEN